MKTKPKAPRRKLSRSKMWGVKVDGKITCVYGCEGYAHNEADKWHPQCRAKAIPVMVTEIRKKK